MFTNPQTSVTYKIIGIDFHFCKDSINSVLNVQLPPQISVSPVSPVICEGESITLTAEGSTDYSWSPSLNLSSAIGSSVVSSANISTTYQIIGSDSENCKDTITFDLSVIPVPTAEIVSGGGSICSGDSAAIVVDVTGNPPWDISYSIDGAVSVITSYNVPTIIYSVSEGTYTIPYIIDANSCSNVGIGSEYVDVLNKPQASIDYNPKDANMLDPEIRFVNNSIFSNTYLWNFGDNTPYSTDFEPIHLYQEDNIYPVMLIAQNGPCVDTAFTLVTINSYYSLYVPNTFTPDGDGKNDYFQPKGVGISDYKIYIYNRWGEEVFSSDDIDICWDGGEGVAGAYSYLINIIDKSGQFREKSGFVLIE